MNIEIKPGAALDDASQIESIVATIESTMAELNQAINRAIPAGIMTDWSEEVKANWMHYYAGDVPAAMDATNATNILKYNNFLFGLFIVGAAFCSIGTVTIGSVTIGSFD